MGMGSHHSPVSLKDEWLTPPEILGALGRFDLDPCAPIPERRPWETAAHYYDEQTNGLASPWFGRVWMNPPYGRETGQWLDRLASHGIGTALIFARTETAMFFEHVLEKADAVLFIKGRLHFHNSDGTRAKGNAGAPSCLVAYGSIDAEILAGSGIAGQFVRLKKEETKC